jgi:hypothetical protein
MSEQLSSFAKTGSAAHAWENGPHIVFLITQGFAARMMLRAGVPDKLITEGARITVISPNADEDYFKNECQVENFSLSQTPPIRNRVAWRFRAYRPYFLDNVDQNPTLKSVHDYLFENKPMLGVGLLGINRTLARSGLFRRASRACERILNRSKHVKRLLRELKPDLLVLPNPFGTEETVYLLHALELDIPVVCQMLSWDNVTAKGTPLLMPDYFISWGPIMTQEIVSLYQFPREKVFECGVPHFDVYSRVDELIPRQRLLSKLNLSPDRPYIFYGTVASMLCPNELEILSWLVDRINTDGFAEPCSLIIRPHPQMLSGMYASNGNELEELKALAGPRVALNIPPIVSERLAWDLQKDDMRHLASLLAGSAMCLNASSTLCLDACMLDRPVINIGFDGYQMLPYQKSARRVLDFVHMAKLLSLKGIRVARAFGELEQHINAYLRDPSLDRSGRLVSARQECGPADGQAADRVANVLLQLAGRRSTNEVCRSFVSHVTTRQLTGDNGQST